MRRISLMSNLLVHRRCLLSPNLQSLVFLDLPRQLLWILQSRLDPPQIGLCRRWERSRHRKVAVKKLQVSQSKVMKTSHHPRKRFQAVRFQNHVQVRLHQVRNLLSKIVKRKIWSLMPTSMKNQKYLVKVRWKVRRKSLELVLISTMMLDQLTKLYSKEMLLSKTTPK